MTRAEAEQDPRVVERRAQYREHRMPEEVPDFVQTITIHRDDPEQDITVEGLWLSDGTSMYITFALDEEGKQVILTEEETADALDRMEAGEDDTGR